MILDLAKIIVKPNSSGSPGSSAGFHTDYFKVRELSLELQHATPEAHGAPC